MDLGRDGSGCRGREGMGLWSFVRLRTRGVWCKEVKKEGGIKAGPHFQALRVALGWDGGSQKWGKLGQKVTPFESLRGIR